ncbi:MAG: T9SS type A sorting domain-containing protein [Saprospiraceae bacterium]
MKFFIISILQLCLLSTISGQVIFERLIERQEINSNYSILDLLPSSDGSCYVLEERSLYFQNPNGILIEGDFALGNTIQNISPTGEIAYTTNLATHHWENTTLFVQGKSPASEFLLLGDKLILPFSPYSAYLECANPLFASRTDRRAVLAVDQNLGDFIENSDVVYQQNCVRFSVENVGSVDGDRYVAIYKDSREMEFYVDIYDIQSNEINSFVLPVDQFLAFDYLSGERFIGVARNSIVLFDLDGSAVATLAIAAPESFVTFDGKSAIVKSTENSIYILYQGFMEAGGRNPSSYFVELDNAGQLISERHFTGQKIVDFTWDDAGFFFLENRDKLLFAPEHLDLPVGIIQTDSALEPMDSMFYGFKFTRPGKIITTSDGDLLVGGTRLMGVRLIEGKAPNQVYLLRLDPAALTATEDLTEMADSFSSWPNPNTGIVQFSAATDVETISVVNMLGQVIVPAVKVAGLQGQINLGGLPNGNYVLIARNREGKTWTSRLVKR